MSIFQWGITAATKSLLHNGEKDGKIQFIAESLDKLITSFYPDDPKGVKMFFARHLLIPITKYLVRETPNGFSEAQTKL